MGYLAWIFLLASVWMSTGDATAQETTAVLRAGEHQEFTRLVLSLPERVSWRLDTQEGFVDLIIEDEAISLDLSQTFDRIPRTRLRALEPLSNGVRLLLACACPVRVIEGIAGQIVIDITSVNPADEAVNGQISLRPKPRPKLPLATVPEPQPEENRVPTRAGVALAQSLRGRRPSQKSTDGGFFLARISGAAASENAAPRSMPTTGNTAEIAPALANMIAGAVSRNLLSVDTEFEPESRSASILDPTALAHLRPLRDMRAPAEKTSGTGCATAISAQIPDWQTDHDIAHPTDWAQLFDPLDRINPDAGYALVATLLRGGLGAEARAVLDLLPDKSKTDSLYNLSYLLDLERPPMPEHLLLQADCSDIDSLWAFMADPAAALGAAGSANRILRAAQSLPAQLRAHLGPSLVQNLLRQNAVETARLVQTLLERTVLAGGTIAAISETDLLLAMPEQLSALDAKQMSALSDTELLLLLDSAEARDLRLPDPVLELVLDRQFALRRSETGQAFAIAAARALARAKEFDKAFQVATSASTELGNDTTRLLLDQLFQQLGATADDTLFVTTYFEQLLLAKELGSNTARQTLVDRLRVLGFTAEASALDCGALCDPARDGQTWAGAATPSALDGTLPQIPSAALIGSSAPPQEVRSQVMASTRPQQPGRDTSSPSTLGDASVQRPEMDQIVEPVGANETNQLVEDETPTAASNMNDGLLAQAQSRLSQAEALRAQLQSLLAGGDAQ